MFLKSIAPLLKGSSKVKVEVTESGEGKLNVLITTTLSKFDPDTTDPVIAARQAALARPIVVIVDAGEDPDAALAAALQGIHPVRADMAANHATYLDDMAKAESDAKAAAKAESEAKAKAKAKTKGTAPSKSAKPASAAPASTDEAADGDDEQGDDDAASNSAPPPGAPSPAPESASSLFD